MLKLLEFFSCFDIIKIICTSVPVNKHNKWSKVFLNFLFLLRLIQKFFPTTAQESIITFSQVKCKRKFRSICSWHQISWSFFKTSVNVSNQTSKCILIKYFSVWNMTYYHVLTLVVESLTLVVESTSSESQVLLVMISVRRYFCTTTKRRIII